MSTTNGKHISIDIETLGTNIDSEIISIGAVVFDMQGNMYEELLLNIRLEEVHHLNMTLGTLQFWLQQPAEAWPECFVNNEVCLQL